MKPTTAQLVESILFISARPMTAKKLADIVGRDIEEVKLALSALMEEYKSSGKGMQLNMAGQSFQMATSSETSGVVQQFLEEEEKKELSKPSLETLTIIAYRGPISKDELELIRGVNCSLILRNLLVRGLIESVEDPITKLQRYQVTFEFLQYLGIRETKELPDYDTLNSNKDLQTLLKEQQSEGSDQDDAIQGEEGNPDSSDDLTELEDPDDENPAELDEREDDDEDDDIEDEEDEDEDPDEQGEDEEDRDELDVEDDK